MSSLLATCAVHGQETPPPQQDTEEAEAQVARPAGNARLEVGNRVATLPFVLSGSGPLFALQPIAAQLNLELKIGPLGESHRLVLPDKEIVVGPESSLLVTVEADGQREISALRETPVRTANGLHVPLDFLELVLAAELGYELSWEPDSLKLALRQRRQLLIEASVKLVHQRPVTTVEIQLSDVPRYRVDRFPGRLEIRLLGDRLRTPVSISGAEDPLVVDVRAGAGGVRIDLAEGVSAAEPRLQQGSSPRLIFELVRQPTAGRPPRVELGNVGNSSGRVETIVIDPGHGGSESGAIGRSGTIEKDMVLDLARDLERRLRRLGFRVVLTREVDQEMSHEARTAIANENRADLFISLHLNSSYGPQAHGAETYFLSREASDQQAALSAETENRSDPGGDRDLGLEWILWDLAQSHHMAQSQSFAKLVQQELNETLGLRNRGVKQAPFRVLIGANMPAVLVELGFISNPEEEARLQGAAYRARLMEALVRAIVRFKRLGSAARDGIESEP